ncbi:MAG: PEP-CTERM sorting domain-containing protein [Limisphaerales bacterium]
MKNKTRNTWLWLGITAITLSAAPTAVQASTNGFVVPFFRGSANSEAGYWEFFSAASGVALAADQPGSTTGATFLQSATSAFLTGGGNRIYSPTEALSFTVADSVPFTLGTVVLQTHTFVGSTPLDYTSVVLNYEDGGPQTLTPQHIVLQLADGDSSLWQWDLTGLGITDYTLTFNAAGTSSSFDSLTVDTWNQFAPVPEPSTFALAGMGIALFGIAARRMKKNN